MKQMCATANLLTFFYNCNTIVLCKDKKGV